MYTSDRLLFSDGLVSIFTVHEWSMSTCIRFPNYYARIDDRARGTLIVQ